MKTFLMSGLFALACLAASVAQAGEGVAIETPYAFAVPSGARSAAAFMTLNYSANADAGMAPDRLMAVRTPVAGRAEIHTILIDDNTMMMRKVTNLPLPPTGRLEFSPQGPHIMMMELRQPLRAGDSFPMTLVFEKAGPVEVAVPVHAPGDGPKTAHKTSAGDISVHEVSEPPEEKEVHDELEETLERGHHH